MEANKQTNEPITEENSSSQNAVHGSATQNDNKYDEHQNLDESNTKLQNNNGVSSHVNSNKRRSSDKIDDQRKSQDRKRNKEKKGPFISDPAKVYLNKNDGVYNPSGHKDSLGSANSMSRMGNHSTKSKDKFSRSLYTSNHQMRHTFGNMSFDVHKIEKNNLGKLYRNETGPGQYEHHELIGKMVVDSN